MSKSILTLAKHMTTTPHAAWQEHGARHLSPVGALRDQLSVAEAADLSAQLPMLIRGIYFEGWTPGKYKPHSRSQSDFLSRVQELFQPNDEDPFEVCQAVFRVLERNVEIGEITHVKQQLSKPIKYLWPSHITIFL